MRVEFDAADGRLDLYVDFARGSRFACPECGRAGCAVHDTKDERWRHLDFFQHRTHLHARTPRVTCPDCGVRKAATSTVILSEASGRSLLSSPLSSDSVMPVPARPA
jgi:transposase